MKLRLLCLTVVISIMACSAVASAQTCNGVSRVVFDGGNNNLDGMVGPTTPPNPTSQVGTPGAINQTPLWLVSKFKFDMFNLPVGTVAGDVVCAELRVPDQDNLRNGSPGVHPFTLEHFATSDDTTVVEADDTAGALASFSPVGGGRDPLVPDFSRYVFVDVTAQVQDDITNARALSSYRWGIAPADALNTTLNPGGDNYQTGDSDCDGNAGFCPPDGLPTDGTFMLIIGLASQETDCTDGVDNDGDTLIDCEDPNCSDNVACPENCSNLIDDDADGDIDCLDSECATIEPCVETICDDSLDGDNDTFTDCADTDCSDDPACPETCDNSVDDDADGDIDCADSECTCNAACDPFPAEDCTNGIDDDCDGDADCIDADCALNAACIPECVGVSMVVFDGGSNALDANAGPTTVPDTGFPILNPGSINNRPLWGVSKFKLDTILPPGTTSADIECASIRIPDMDQLRNGAPGLLPYTLQHFETTDNTKVVQDDGIEANTPPLTSRTPVAGGRQPLVPDVFRFHFEDATVEVKNDLDNGRPLSSWRWGVNEADSVNASGGIGDQYSTGCADCGGNTSFCPPNGLPTDGTFMLTIRAATHEQFNCANGIDDDGDGDIDCFDSDCATIEPCVETICDDSLDGDNDTFTDCDDSDCSDDPTCAEICDNSVDDDADGDVDCADSECFAVEPCVETICNDGLDGDNDTFIDCDDTDCSDDPACPEVCDNSVDDDADGAIDCADLECVCEPICDPPPAESCGNSFDDDCDGDTDCDDSDCFAAEPCIETICDDSLDGDNDGLTDCDDPDCSGLANCPTTVMMKVHEGGNTSLDAFSLEPGGPINLTFILAFIGSQDLAPVWFISKFKLDTVLPAGTTSADIISATLSVPDQNLTRVSGSAGGPSGLDLVLHHFATGDETQVVDADRHETTLELTDFGVVIPAGGTGSAGQASAADVDVTNAIKDDLDNARGVSSFRVGHDPASLVGHTGSDQYQWGSADCSIINGGAGLPGFCPPDGDPNVMKLTIVLAAGAGPCNDPFADADGDGDSDQADFANVQLRIPDRVDLACHSPTAPLVVCALHHPLRRSQTKEETCCLWGLG